MQAFEQHIMITAGSIMIGWAHPSLWIQDSVNNNQVFCNTSTQLIMIRISGIMITADFIMIA